MPQFDQNMITPDMSRDEMIAAINENFARIRDTQVKTGGLATDAVTPDKVTNRTRRIDMYIQADEGGGAIEAHSGGPEVQFSGTPTGYARGWCTLPSDYVPGTDATLHILSRSDSTNSNETVRKYVGTHTPGETWSSTWDEISASTYTLSWATNEYKDDAVEVIASSNLTAGDLIIFAWRVDTAITGNIYVTGAYVEYTADS